MARDTDFLDLYKILGVQPDCELTEFKQAYRRRVLVLHPDRRGQSHSDHIASERLQRLTALYGAAMRFERQHGRLPGASAIRSTEAPVTRTEAAATAPSRRPKPTTRRSRWLLAAVVIVGLSWLWWSHKQPSAPAVSATVIITTAPARRSTTPAATGLPSRLALGMDSATVRALEGAPVMINGGRWEYGPSWIRFEDDHVVDWYSSQLQPLKASRNPGEAAQ
ncbi:MAG TPA: J domain-containing protein [Rhodanobacter sp.]|nr:J domain-containing protein [Rhodanobacter sp.]